MQVRRSIPLYEQVYELLWERIARGAIAPGDRIKDTDWSVELGVSRTPVREALRKLEHDMVLEPSAGGGYVLRAVTAEDLRMLYRCRTALEGLAVREAVARLEQEDFVRLARTIDASHQAAVSGARNETFNRNTEFHETIVLASGNPHLIRLLASLRRQILYYRTALLGMANLDGSAGKLYERHIDLTQEAHMGILEALREGDPNEVERLMLRHLEETTEDMDNILAALGKSGRES